MTTVEYTIAAQADIAQMVRSRKAGTDLWVRQTDTGGFGCWESYDGRDKWRLFLRYPLDIPVGATIASAYVTFTAKFDDFGDQSGDEAAYNALIYRADYADCANIDTLWVDHGEASPFWYLKEGDLDLIDMAANPVTWVLPAVGWSADEQHDSPDIARLVQEQIDAVGYAPGNGFALIFHEGDADDGAEGNPGSMDEDAYRFGYTFDDGNSPVLHVTYHQRNFNSYATTFDALTQSQIGS